MRVESFLWAAGFFGAVVLSLQCSSNNSSCSIDASHYDRSCKQDSDCIAVYSGSFCGSGSDTCACENAAISASAQSQYDSDLSATHPLVCPCPAPPAVGCNAGTCVVTPGSTVWKEAGAD